MKISLVLLCSLFFVAAIHAQVMTGWKDEGDMKPRLNIEPENEIGVHSLDVSAGMFYVECYRSTILQLVKINNSIKIRLV